MTSEKRKFTIERDDKKRVTGIVLKPCFTIENITINGNYVIRTEQEENERNLAIKALVNKYGKAIEHRLEHNVIAGIKNEIEEML